MPDVVETALQQLVIANRFLGQQGILDAYGHVSARHPDDPGRFFMARARAPELVTVDDLYEFDLSGVVLGTTDAQLYIERYIHAAIYEARPDIRAVCHNHAVSLLPFSISRSVTLRAVIHSAGFLGEHVPVWDMAADFGPDRDLLVRSLEHARSLAKTMADSSAVLMRGHGAAIGGPTMDRLISMCIATDKNARALATALQLGEIIPLSAGEVAARSESGNFWTAVDGRAWEYYEYKARAVGNEH